MVLDPLCFHRISTLCQPLLHSICADFPVYKSILLLATQLNLK